MSDGTHIEWSDASWNPIRARRKDGQPNKGPGGWACQRVSAGCQHCYAAGINKRLGTGFDYDAKGIAQSDIYLDEKVLTQPLHWTKPRKIFVCSMTDLFGEWVPFRVLDRILAVMAVTPQHTYQVLTKRPERAREYLGTSLREFEPGSWHETRALVAARAGRDFNGPGVWISQPWTMPWPLSNLWLGASVEDQEAANARIPVLLDTTAAVRFISLEPALGLVDLAPWFGRWRCLDCGNRWEGPPASRYRGDGATFLGFVPPCCQRPESIGICAGPGIPELAWVIVGGESGPGARPCDVEWIRSIVRQCQAAGVPVFVKQDSGSKPSKQGRIPDDIWALKEFPHA